jgi:hypothetical protein
MYELTRPTLAKGYTAEPTPLQEAIDQIGLDAVRKSLAGIPLGFCDLHGHYLIVNAEQPRCPLCPNPEGVTATQVEHYINLDPAHQLGTNPQQKVNPLGI